MTRQLLADTWEHCWTCDSDILPGQPVTVRHGVLVHAECAARAAS
jgi:hypothetical protein